MRREIRALAAFLTVLAATPSYCQVLGNLPVLRLGSADFENGGAQPADAQGSPCGGTNISPELHWAGAPAGTKSFAITEFDRDAPSGFWHWLLVDIPPNVAELPAGAPLPPGAIAGMTSYNLPGYRGPCPPSGLHHYIFTVSALNIAALPGMTGNSKGNFVANMLRGHVLAQGSIIGTFQSK